MVVVGSDLLRLKALNLVFASLNYSSLTFNMLAVTAWLGKTEIAKI